MTGERRGRNTAEWVTFGISLLILLLLAGQIGRDLLAEERPADPVASVAGPARKVGDRFVVTVEVVNRGDNTAVEVQVLTELRVGEERHEADSVVDFLAGAATEEIEVVLPQDPAAGELTVTVTGFQHP